MSGGKPTIAFSQVATFFARFLEISQLSFAPAATEAVIANFVHTIAQPEGVVDPENEVAAETKGVDLLTFAEFFQAYLAANKSLVLVRRSDRKTPSEGPTTLVASGKDQSCDESQEQKQEAPVAVAKKSDQNQALKEIFEFYCKQQLLIGRKATFEQLNSALTNMNMGEFMRFCKDFAVPLPTEKQRELFKKTAKLGKALDWSSFRTLLSQVASAVEGAKGSEPSPDAAKQFNDFCRFLGCADPAKYRRKLSGMGLPFNTRDKSFRIPIGGGKYKFVAEKSKAEISQEMELIKRRRIERMQTKGRETQQKYEKGRQVLQRIRQQQMKDRLRSLDSGTGFDSEAKSRVSVVADSIICKGDEQKRPVAVPKQCGGGITWALLKNMSYNDINAMGDNDNGDSEFQPAALGDIDSEEERVLRRLQGLQAAKSVAVLGQVPEPRTHIRYSKTPLRKPCRVNRSLEYCHGGIVEASSGPSMEYCTDLGGAAGRNCKESYRHCSELRGARRSVEPHQQREGQVRYSSSIGRDTIDRAQQVGELERRNADLVHVFDRYWS